MANTVRYVTGILSVLFIPSGAMATKRCDTSPVLQCEIEKTSKVVRVCEANR